LLDDNSEDHLFGLEKGWKLQPTRTGGRSTWPVFN